MRIIILIFLIGKLLFSWEGYDYDSGSFISIESGNLVRSGEVIEVFDYNDGSFHFMQVIGIARYGGIVEITVVDMDTGEMRIFEMEG